MKGLAARRQSSSDRTWYQLFCHIVSNTAHYTIATSGKKRTAASVTSEGQANKLKRLAGHLKGIYLHGAGQSGLETLRTANIQQQANCERRHAKRAAAEEARQDTAKRVSAVADLMTESMAKEQTFKLGLFEILKSMADTSRRMVDAVENALDKAPRDKAPRD